MLAWELRFQKPNIEINNCARFRKHQRSSEALASNFIMVLGLGRKLTDGQYDDVNTSYVDIISVLATSLIACNSFYPADRNLFTDLNNFQSDIDQLIRIGHKKGD